MQSMESKSEKLLSSLKEYYKDAAKLQLLLDVIHTKYDTHDKVSLRLIDWLVTNYSKSVNIVYEVHGRSFNMHHSYKNMLKAYSKKMFDPFRRHARVFLKCPEGNPLETTVAQLTFFKWAIENHVITYAVQHKQAIKYHMDLHTEHRFQPEAYKHIKRKELSKGSKGANMYSVNVKVSFT